ncbi:DUF192 domain-containing protein [Bacillus sp. T3]|uniref:DUF192 domain-containing protein n=1 Tax=Bacillus sp. T3 TaxID=467262 RepID=UPI00298282FB|nr:DUF192 domain-containing protein [Bacillus sp. T3]
MKIFRQNHDIDVPILIKVCDRFWPRFRGLMFRRKPLVDEGILLVPCNSIHMFFMFFPIDVVFLDRNDVVVVVRKNVKPNMMIFPIRGAEKVLELPIGTVEKYSIEVKDQIVL